MKKLVVLIIMDGFGYNKDVKGNVIVEFKIFNLDRIKKEYLNILINVSGFDVGLFDG